MDQANTPSVISEGQYAEIETAIMGSERGRTFLREFLKRNRHADTSMLLEAISRLENALCPKTVDHRETDDLLTVLAEIANVMTATQSEVAAIRNDLVAGRGAIPEEAGSEPREHRDSATEEDGTTAETDTLESTGENGEDESPGEVLLVSVPANRRA